jgi:ligand-binding sensor domain-containing protein
MDLEGNLWIAGRNSLAKYDGNNITIWDDSKLEDISIQNGSILSMNIDNEDNIWIGTMKYVIVKFDGSQFTNYNSENSGLPQSVTAATAGIKSIDFDKSHNVWISCTENGIVKFDGKDWIVYNKDNSELPTNVINGIKVDKTGNIWIATNLGLAKYDNQNWTIFNKENTGFPSDKFIKISIDNSNNIWAYLGKDFGVDYGIIKFDGVDFTLYNKSNSGLKGNAIKAIFIDSYDNKWLSVSDNLGYNGVNVFKESGVILTSVEEADYNLIEFVIAPNPATDFIEINLNKGLQPLVQNLQIFDILGIDVSPAGGGVSRADGGGFKIDISHLHAGVYYLRIGNNVEKFLKM